MTLAQILNTTQAWLASQFGHDIVRKWLEDIETPVEVVQARKVAEENAAGMKALSQVAMLPRAGR